MSATPALEQQIARTRAARRTGQPRYARAARGGAMAGLTGALYMLADRLLPALQPRPPVTLGGALAILLTAVALGALLAVALAGAWRRVRRAWLAARAPGPVV